jgi:hypothetical protein
MARRPDRKPTAEELRLTRQVRLAAIVMSVTMVVWVAGQYDLAAIAALVWSLVVTYWVWRARRRS